jgi:membrane-anchored protein YejM (alkaline phosphatase superfamily)
MSGQSSAHAVTYPFLRKSFQTIGYTSTNSFLASHHDNNVVETADEDLYNLLKFLKEGDYLRNTLVILMSDHGARFSSLRSSLQGKQEERLPFFGFSFPAWFAN